MEAEGQLMGVTDTTMEVPTPMKKKKRRRRCICVGVTVTTLVVVAVAAVVPSVIFLRNFLVKLPERPGHRLPPFKVDCHPEQGATIATCQARGCEWTARDVVEEPQCVFVEGQGYKAQSDPEVHDRGMTFDLKRTSNATLYGNEIQTVRLTIRYISRTIVQLKFTDPNQNRYEVPADPPIEVDSEIFNQTYDVVWENHPQFGVIVRRKPLDYWSSSEGQSYDMTLVFDTRNPGLVFSSQFLQVPIRLPSSRVFGLGVQRHKSDSQDLSLSMQWRKWTLWPTEAKGAVEQSLGAHPFLMTLEDNGKASGIFLRNSNAMEVILQPDPAVVFRTLGGVLDFYVFLGPTPENVIQQYTQMVGRPTLPPYWSLGFHFGRQKMANVTNLIEMVNRMQSYNIPFDSINLGEDGLYKDISFTYNDVSFISVTTTLKQHLDQHARKALISSWAGVASKNPLESRTYPALTQGQKQNLFIGQKSSTCEGKVSSQSVFYPDYSHPQASEYWKQIVTNYRGLFTLDNLHILLDRNSPTNDGDGCSNQCPQNKWNNPPYVPQGLKGSLYQRTLCPDAQQAAGSHYDVHNLYSVQQARAAFSGWKRAFPRQRPFVLSRFHAPGLGQYAGHFISNTYSNWPDLQQSIIDILQLNLVGIPLVGSDICGYRGNASAELCIRWTQLGAFYPFSRNYNYADTADQYPASYRTEAMTQMKKAIEMRYLLLPYLYTLFHLASSDGGTVARPLFHEFPTDNQTIGISDQFLWGPGLLVNPVVKPSGQQNGAYLPQASRWYYLFQQSQYKGGAEVKYSFGQTLHPRDDLLLLLRGGHIVPMHSKVNYTTYNSHPLHVIVALDQKLEAHGWLYVDDKETPVSESQYFSKGTRLRFQMKDNQLTIQPMTSGYNDGGVTTIGSVQFLGVPQRPLHVAVNNKPNQAYTYNEFDKVIEVSGLGFKITDRWNSIQLGFTDDDDRLTDWKQQQQQQQQQRQQQ